MSCLESDLRVDKKSFKLCLSIYLVFLYELSKTSKDCMSFLFFSKLFLVNHISCLKGDTWKKWLQKKTKADALARCKHVSIINNQDALSLHVFFCWYKILIEWSNKNIRVNKYYVLV